MSHNGKTVSVCEAVFLLSAWDPLLCIILVMEASADRDLRVGGGTREGEEA